MQIITRPWSLPNVAVGSLLCDAAVPVVYVIPILHE